MVTASVILVTCSSQKNNALIFDTDANNELDDQHALAYLLLNQDHIFIEGITVNATRNGGEIESHYQEARRVMRLCNEENNIPLLNGANSDFKSISPFVLNPEFDGSDAVNFIIKTAHKYDRSRKLIVLPVGKLTNVALALLKDPTIVHKMRVVWLGSNYPKSGEYNLENDIPAMNYVLNSQLEFEMAVCRYRETSGTDHVKVTQETINQHMRGKGPVIEEAVEGRHGGLFNNFGDYSCNLFEHAEFYGDPPSRSLFDMAAVAIIKNPKWARKVVIPCPIMENKQWIERPSNSRTIVIWEHFKTEQILNDFFKTF